jgi:hypothetical protein
MSLSMHEIHKLKHFTTNPQGKMKIKDSRIKFSFLPHFFKKSLIV